MTASLSGSYSVAVAAAAAADVDPLDYSVTPYNTLTIQQSKLGVHQSQ